MIAEAKIKDYLNELKSGAPVPGGGAVCALSGAQGAALIMMVANHTIGKKKYAEYEALNIAVRDEAESLRVALLKAADDDETAFSLVGDAYALPKSTDEEKIARKKAISMASIEAAKPPLNVMKNAYRTLELTSLMLGKSNKSLESDLFVAELQLKACIQGAKYNVDANIVNIQNEFIAKSIKEESDLILEKTSKINLK